MLSSITEKVYRFEFTKEQITSKAALKVVDEWTFKNLPISSKIKNWGGKCTLTENSNGYICEIALILKTN